jgi:hypothetical protein
MRVIVMGAGIGGLSCAHELIKQGNEVIVIEKNRIVGGLARTQHNESKETGKTHSELCWKLISKGYINLLNILSEVEDGGEKLIARLRPMDNFIYAGTSRNVSESTNSFVTTMPTFWSEFHKITGEKISLMDSLFLMKTVITAKYCSDKTLAELDNVKWCDYVKDCSETVKRWILDSTAIYLGMDYKKISVNFVFQLLRRQAESDLLAGPNVFYAFNGPMSEVFLEPWKRWLEKKGVKFIHQKIASIHIKNKNIDYIMADEKYTADVFVNAMDARSSACLRKSHVELFEAGKQIQCQITFYTEQVIYGANPTIVIFPDSPWFLMTRIESTIWNTNYDVLSTGIGIWDVAGYNGKTAADCTEEELAEECWLQMIKSKHNLSLPNRMPEWDLWNTFTYDGKMTTTEPKFSNNIGTLNLRPEIKDLELKNLYNATAYARTEMNVYNMESASEAGVKAGLMIGGLYRELEKKKSIFERFMSFFFRA